MKTILLSLISALAGMSLVLTSCGGKEERREAKMNKGFRLPEGDAERGKATFVQLKCHQCHSVEGADLPPAEGNPSVRFALGGEVTKVKSYGELVTAIIQPQHVVSPEYLASIKKSGGEGQTSSMPEYNETMTVRQMSDLVVFLHGHYKQYVPAYDQPYY